MKYMMICALILTPLACADEAAKTVKIEQLLTLMNVAQQQKQMMAQMSQMVLAQVKEQIARQGNVSQDEMAKMEDRQKRLFALIGEKTSWENMKPVYLKAYADTFSEGEIDGIVAFYKTPAGKAMVDKQPLLNTKIMASLRAQMGELMPRIEEIMKQ